MASVDNSFLYALEFSKDLKAEDVSILLTKLAEGGLNLTSATPSVNEGLTVFVSIDDERILSVARKCRIKTLEGDFLPEIYDNENNFQDDMQSSDGLEDNVSTTAVVDKKDARALFSPADILWMTRHEIDNVRSPTKQILTVAGIKITLFQGQSVVEKFLHKKFVEKIYPLHEAEDLKRLSHDWLGSVDMLKTPVRSILQKQPIVEIRQYFGEGVAFYFSFLETLTWALVVPSIFGVIQLLMPADFNTLLFFCTIYLLWSFGFMEWWKRQSNGLSFLWGTRSKYGGGQGEPRANYRGEFVLDPISGQFMPYYPKWKTMLKLYGVSVPIVLLCTLAAFWLMLESIWKEQALIEWTASWTEDGGFWGLMATLVVSLPTIIYAVLVWFANQLYRKLANRLTEWENHRTESQFERNRVTKLILFEFTNNFMSLFYIAFYLKDIAMLRWQVVLMLLVLQVINQLTETLFPYLGQRKTLKALETYKFGEKNENLIKILEHLKIPMLEPDHHRVTQARKESLLEPYEGMHEDYLELFIQFGYVVLFVVAYPMAALWALVNNIAELRVDGFKVIRIFRRPFPARVAHIGAWEPAFRMMCSIAVVSNCALLYIMFTADTNQEDYWNRAIICVSLDHILLALQSLLSVLVPATPRWVQVARAEQKRLKLKKQ